MSTNAGTWFYAEPERNPYAIVERLNGTFWQARAVQVVFFECTRAEPPFLCRGYWHEQPIELEWQPKSWLALRGAGDLAELAPLVGRVLGRRADFRYREEDGRYVYEWQLDEAGRRARWQALQGQPSVRQPERLRT